MLRVLGPKGKLIIRAINPARLAKLLPGLVKRFHRVQVVPVPAPKPVPQPITMYDSVNVSQIPLTAAAVAGYVGGLYPTFSKLQAMFPKAHKLSIAINADEDAECLDIEQGDAVPDQAPLWVKRQQARGVKRPVLYTSLAQAAALVDVMNKAFIPRSAYRLWTAHYSYQSHRCNASCGFGFLGEADATQWTDKALGRNLDASICVPDFFA